MAWPGKGPFAAEVLSITFSRRKHCGWQGGEQHSGIHQTRGQELICPPKTGEKTSPHHRAHGDQVLSVHCSSHAEVHKREQHV